MWPRCSSASPGAPAKHPAPDAPIRFRVTRAGAKSPFIDASVEVRLQHQSDGCGGGGYTRGLAFTKEDGLLATVPKAVSRAWTKQLKAEATASS